MAPLTLLLPRAFLSLRIVPAGIAFFTALTVHGLERLPWYLLGMLLSLIFSEVPDLALTALPAFLLLLLLGRGKKKKPLFLVLAAALATFASDLVSCFLLKRSVFVPWPLLLGETGGVVLLSFIFIRAVPTLLRQRTVLAYGGEEELFFALIPLALATTALARFNPFGFNLAAFTACFLVTFAGYLGGPGLGAGMGLLFFLIPGWKSFASWPSLLGWALGGLIGGMLHQYGRLATAAGFSLGFLLPLISVLERLSTPLLASAGGGLLGLGIFLALPIHSLKEIGLSLPEEHSWRAVKRKEQVRLHALLSERVQDLAEIFTELSKAFADEEALPSPEPDLYGLLEEIVRRACRNCHGFTACWQQNFYRSYRALFDLLALVEMTGEARPENLRGHLGAFCLQPHRLASTAETVLSRLRAEAEARRRIIEGRGFVADQLEGIAEIMSGLAKEMHRDVEFRLEIEERLKSSFNRFGLAVESVNVFDYGRDMLEVRVKKHGCLNYFECQYLIAPMVSRLLGYTFTIWEKRCPRGGDHDCCFTLVPAGKYQIKHAVVGMAKDPAYPGDSYTTVKTKDGRFAIILSDGMGTGIRAAQESRATVDLLAQFISSGFKEEFTLNLINSVLMLRTPEERFATVDLALIDLFRGELEMIKIGAAPSYIKHNREIISIKAATPPAGILQELALERQRYTLVPGDYLILATDGIFAGELGPEETEDWMERALARVEVSGPQPMAEFLLQLAQVNMGQETKDDVTIIAAQLLPAEL